VDLGDGTILAAILQQPAPRQCHDAGQGARQAGILDRAADLLAALAAKGEDDATSFHRGMALQQGRGAVAAIRPGIGLVADADMAAVDDRGGAGQCLVLTEVAAFQIARDCGAQLRQRIDQALQPLELAALANLVPFGVIAVLGAAGFVMPDGLEMGAGIGRDLHVDIGWRDGERANALQRLGIDDAAPLRIKIGEAAAEAAARDRQGRGRHPFQAARCGGRTRSILDDHLFHVPRSKKARDMYGVSPALPWPQSPRQPPVPEAPEFLQSYLV
jgi:hypothetical protein